MRILLLTINYHPEPIGIAPLVTDLAEALAAAGHRVTVVTAMPSYPADVVAEAYRGRWLVEEEIRGVRVIRTWVLAGKRSSAPRRILFYASFLLSAGWGLFRAGRQDVIYCSSSPPHLGLVGALVARMRGIPLVFNVQDLMTEAAVELGRLRPGPLLKFLRWTESFVRGSASRITVIAESFREHLVESGVPAGKIAVLPNWVDTDFIRPGDRRNAFREELGLGDEFLVLSAGNIGMQHGLEFLVGAAERLRDERAIRFCLVGDGSGREALEGRARELGLPNLTILPLQPRERLPEVLAAGDLFFVGLRPEYRGSWSQPSRMLAGMAAGRPLLLALHEGTDGARIVKETGCGVRVPPGDADAIAGAIRELAAGRTRAEEMGRRGRACVEAHFSRRIVLPRQIALFEEFSGGAAKDFFGAYAADFDRIYDEGREGWRGFWNRALRRSMFERMERTVEVLRPLDGKRILDVGSGSGRGTVLLALEGAGEVVGVEPAPSMNAIALRAATEARVAGRCRFLEGEFLQIPEDVLQPPYDGAVALGLLDYIEDPVPLLGRMARVTTGPSILSFPVRWHWLTPQRKLRYRLRRCPLFFYDEGEVEDLIRRAGFGRWEIHDLGRDYLAVAWPRPG